MGGIPRFAREIRCFSFEMIDIFDFDAIMNRSR